MMDEKNIAMQVSEEDGGAVDIIQDETVEYVEVENPEDIVIEIEEGILLSSGSDGNFAPIEHNHGIEKIDGLQNTLDVLAIAKDHHSIHGGFAEFREWLPASSKGYYKNELASTGGVGYFVSLVRDETKSNITGGNIYIDICRKTNADQTVDVADIYGVTVDVSGFYGYQSEEHSLLSNNGPNKDNPNYAKVCLLGDVKVRVTADDHLNINIGDYVIPNELGYAKKSNNNVGFKVISKGQIESVGDTVTGWYYVNIALVPQNDNVSRVMKELEETRNNVVLQIGSMQDDVANMNGIVVDVSGKVDKIDSVVSDNTDQVNKQLQISKELVENAQKIADEANKTINDTALAYTEAISKANDAKDLVDDALATVNQMKQELNPLAQWKEDGTSNIAGFVAQANADSVTLGSITQAYGTDLTGIIQKIDENGAVIQHLVTHVDKYTLGEHSPANGLSADELGILQPGIIYVPTVDHDEDSYINDEQQPFKFYLGKSYIFKANDIGEYMWAEDKPVSTSTSKFNGMEDGDLWYCWQGVIDGDKYTYSPGTLYRWDGLWVAVASVNDKSSRAIGLINQTAEKLTVAYTNLEGDMSDLTQTANEISTRVSTVEGDLSEINQTAENIRLGIYDPIVGSSKLELLLGGMDSTSTYMGHVLLMTIGSAAPEGVTKYSNPPMWDGGKFIFSDGDVDVDGEYFFSSDDHTQYCKVLNDSAYDIYTIGNPSIASLNTRVTNTASEIESWTRFQKGQNETMTSINQTSDEAGAAISSMVFGDFRECAEIKLELSDDDKLDFATDRYDEPPAWKEVMDESESTTKQFIFEIKPVDNGEYCLSVSDTSSYYKLLYRGVEVVGYEKYTMNTQPYSAIVQKVEDGQSYIGLIAGDDDKIGSVVINTINGKSEALISADKIGINGTTVFSSLFNNGTTTINGDYIRSGMLQSNDYAGAITYRKYGLKIQNNEIVEGTDEDFIYFVEISKDTEYANINVTKFDDIQIDNFIEEDVKSVRDYFNFEADSGTITGLTEKGKQLTELVIPNQIDDCVITNIDDNAFEECTSFTSVIFSEGITRIGSKSFYNCTNLISITIPDSVTSIGSEAFCSCDNLATINVHDGLIDIGYHAFWSTGYEDNDDNWQDYLLYIGNNLVEALSNITYFEIRSGTVNICDYAFAETQFNYATYPSSLVRIGRYAFKSCPNIKGFVVPSSVVEIGDEAFYDCYNLGGFTFNNNIQNIGKGIFKYCEYLKEVILPEGITEISDDMFYENTRLVTINIPDTVSKIGNRAFVSCINIDELDLPNVTYVGDNAFSGCTNLTTIKFPNVEHIGSYAFSYCSALDYVNIPARQINIGYKAFLNTNTSGGIRWKNNGLYVNVWHLVDVANGISSFEIPYSTVNMSEQIFRDSSLTNITFESNSTFGTYLKAIPKRAFQDCVNLTSITIPNSVTDIDEYAFEGCTGLTSVTLGNSIVSIGTSAFDGCNALTSITIPDSVIKIEKYAFCGCSNLTTVTLGTGIAEVAYLAFGSCESLDSVYISDLTAWCNILFESLESNPLSYATNLYLNDSLLTDVIIPSDITKINDYAFSRYGNLISITMHDGITSIGCEAFYYCDGLTSVFMGNSITNIGKYAFYNCHLLTDVIIPDSVTVIEDYAFDQCYNLTSVALGKSIASICEGAFYNCSGLTSIIVPDSVVSIGDRAFVSCENLKSITIGDNIKNIGRNAFSGCDNLTSVYISNLTSWCLINFDNASSNPLYYGADIYVNDNALTNLIIPEGITSIQTYAFYGCSSLNSVVIANDVVSIGNYAFYKCENLLSISIQDEITYIGAKAFYNTAYYNNVDAWQDDVLYIDNYLIEAKADIMSYSIPDGILTIGEDAFANCSNLTYIKIPFSVINIGANSFYSCDNITIECLSKSYAEAYAQVHYINYITNSGCYSCDSVNAGEELIPYIHKPGIAEKYFYVVSEDYFLIELALGCTEGMLLNLNEGTIYSKNLILDKTGKLFITGDINATGGYIGNKEEGFSIEYTYSGLMYKVREDVLPKGSYYFKEVLTIESVYSEEESIYYKFKLLTDLQKDDVICLNFEDNYIYVNDIKHAAIISISYENETDGFTLIEYDEKTHKGYNLNSRQHSLRGTFDSRSGVYIGADGIGVGNGLLMMKANGSLNILDDAELHISKNSNNDDVAFSMSLLAPLRQMAWTIYNPRTKVYDAAMLFNKGSYTMSSSGTTINKYNGTFHFYYGIDMHGKTITNQSDARLKTNIKDVDFYATDILNQIELKSFDWLETNNHQNIGIIAQQLESVLPDLVVTDEKTGLKSVAYMELISYLVKAVQELSAIVNPPIQMLSLDDEIETNTSWSDDMTDEEKEKYVQIERDSKSFYIPQED